MSVPPPPLPPAPLPAPGLLHGSVAYTLLFSVCGAVTVFAAFFALRVGEQRPDWRPPASSERSTLRVSRTFRGRVRLLAAAVFATDEEVAARCGGDALHSLRCNRACACMLAGAALPALLGVLPLVLAGDGGGSGFARTTVSNAKQLQGELHLAILISVCVAAAAVHAGCAHLEAQLRGVRTAVDSPASVSLLLRGLTRRKAGADAADELKALFEERWPGGVHAVYVPLDRFEERLVERQLAAAPGARRASLERKLEGLRAQPAHGAGIGFIVCRSHAAAARILAELAPLRVRGVLGELCSASEKQPWRSACWAPPPETLYRENIGLGPFGRSVRTACVNVAVFVVLCVVACPGVLAVVTFDAAALNPSTFRRRWTHFVAHAGLTAGLLLQWVPSLLTLLLMTQVMPGLLRWATRLERHLSSGSEARAMLLKASTFYNLNVLFVLSFGRAALAALAQQALDCHWAHVTGQDCTGRFVKLLGSLYISSSSAGVMCLLSTSSTFWLTLELLQWRAGLRDLLRFLWRRSTSTLDTPLLEEEQAAPARVNDTAAPDSQHVFAAAYNASIFSVALCYGTVAPLVLLPGVVFFLGRCAVDKWLLLTAPPAACRPPSDGSLARTAVLLLRVASLLHVAAMAAYLRGQRGGTRESYALVVLALAILTRVAAAALFDSNAHVDDAAGDARLELLQAGAAYQIDDGVAELQPGEGPAPAAPRFRFDSAQS